MTRNNSEESVVHKSDSDYYQHIRSVPLASRVSQRIRTKMFDLFVSQFPPDQAMQVLDLGVTCDTAQEESNYFEKLYPYPGRITCVGTEDGSHLMQQHPGLRYERVTPGQPLPFDDNCFDVVFSNAVLEHVGNRQDQAAFLRELMRVGKAFFVTTPNRWFPVEHHTGLPFLHYLPASLFRAVLRHTGYEYWAAESNLNILTANQFKALFPPGATVAFKTVRFCGITSNLVAFGNTAG